MPSFSWSSMPTVLRVICIDLLPGEIVAIDFSNDQLPSVMGYCFRAHYHKPGHLSQSMVYDHDFFTIR